MIWLSPHFCLDEFTHSQTANRLGIGNTPDDETEEGMAVINNLVRLATGLELVRHLVGGPVVISSGYRSPKLNEAVGGAKNSQHMTGKAADITVPGMSVKEVMALIMKHRSEVYYDQLISEYVNPAVAGSGWTHISFVDKNPRMEALITDRSGTRYA